MQPKCPKCKDELQEGCLKLLYCAKVDCDWTETAIDDLISRTKDQEVYLIAQNILDYLESQAIRKVIESDRLTRIEESLANLERGRDKEGDMKI